MCDDRGINKGVDEGIYSKKRGRETISKQGREGEEGGRVRE